MLIIINSTMGSALPSNALPFIGRDWGIESETTLVLPISMYLIGEVVLFLCSLLAAPLHS